MTKAKKSVKSAPKKEVVSPKKQPSTKSYPLKTRLKVSGVWKEKGETIKLTESQFRDFRQKQIV